MNANPIYTAWGHMKGKVSRAKRKGSPIAFEPEWALFDNFQQWSFESGYQPGYKFIRYNVWEGFTKQNCTWIDPVKKITSKRRLYDVDGDILSIKEIAEIYGCEYEVIAQYDQVCDIKRVLNKEYDAGIQNLWWLSEAEMEAYLAKNSKKLRCR